jgi:UDP-glucose 4-epimerase
VIVKSFEHLVDNRAPVVYGDGEQSLDYVYVDDAVDATCRALEAPLSGEVLNIASGVATRVSDLIGTIIRVSGKNIAAERAEPDWTQGSRRAGDPEKAARLLGWRAKTSLEAGLSATFDWIKANAGERRT